MCDLKAAPEPHMQARMALGLGLDQSYDLRIA
jgi:hypothetical protein